MTDERIDAEHEQRLPPVVRISSVDGSRQGVGQGRRGIGLAAVVLVALVLWGGYSHHWSWTGINGHTATLWDWLKLLLLPLAVAVLPIWMNRDARLDQRIKTAALTMGGVFAVVVLAGYLVPWRWTGFDGNNLWDWLNLVALPLAVAMVPFLRDVRRDWTLHHTAWAAAGAVVTLMLVLGGYLGHWRWTGFTGNTLWQWLHLLLLPLLLPTVIVPGLTPRARARMTPLQAAEGDATDGDAAEGDATAAGEPADGEPATSGRRA